MRTFQFWFLVICSSVVSALMIKQIFLIRAVTEEQRTLVDTQEVISEGTGYQTAWKQLAYEMVETGHQDPALAAVLRSANLQVRPHSPAGTPSPSPIIPPPTPSSSGAPGPPANPTAP